MAQSAGLDGVVASPLETAAIRAPAAATSLVVTPGIRGASAGGDKNDQSRTMGPAEAVAAGASYIVVGRPIIAAADPRQAAEAIARELAGSDAGSREPRAYFSADVQFTRIVNGVCAGVATGATIRNRPSGATS